MERVSRKERGARDNEIEKGNKQGTERGREEGLVKTEADDSKEGG